MKQNNRNEKIWKLAFVAYLVLILRFIIFKYPMKQLMEIAEGWKKEVIWEGLSTANFTLGESIKMYIRYFHYFTFWNGIANLLGNVLAFIPLGIFLPQCRKKCRTFLRVFIASFFLILFIELFQLFSAFGAFDIDDILLNMTGSMMGYGIWIFLQKKTKK